jgi:hypothetical protein
MVAFVLKVFKVFLSIHKIRQLIHYDMIDNS